MGGFWAHYPHPRAKFNFQIAVRGDFEHLAARKRQRVTYLGCGFHGLDRRSDGSEHLAEEKFLFLKAQTEHIIADMRT